jgi:hypothetical protein
MDFLGEVLIRHRRGSLRSAGAKEEEPDMDVETSFAAWRKAYERAFAGAKRLPLVLRLTPAVLFYVACKQLRYTPEEGRNAQKNERI